MGRPVPVSINPVTQKPYGGSFPRVSVGDTVRVHFRLLDELGIDRLHAVVGGSVGGMMCLDAATRYPDRMRFVAPIAGGLKATALHIIHDFEQVNAIYNDPNFNGGDYYEGPPPDAGMALARTISHKTFVSLEHMERRARDEVVGGANERVSSPLESYMWYQGQKFVQRFDANAYLRTMWMWQDFDLYRDAEREGTTVAEMLARGEHEYLVFSMGLRCMLLPQSARRADGGAQSGGGAVQLDHSAHRKGPRLVPARGAPFRAASSLSLRIGMGSPVMDRG